MNKELRGKPSSMFLALFGMLLATGSMAHAQSYTLDWSTIDGGGGTSTGGVYSVRGAIGQPDAGLLSGGSYTLQGGFWGVTAAVQTPGAPWLTIVRTSTNTVVVSWPLTAAGWILEATNAVPQVSAPWPQVNPPYETNGTNLQFTEPLPAGNKFYRLHKPWAGMAMRAPGSRWLRAAITS